MSLRRPEYLNYLWPQRTRGEREIEGDRVKRERERGEKSGRVGGGRTRKGWGERNSKTSLRDKNELLFSSFQTDNTKWGTPLITSVILCYIARSAALIMTPERREAKKRTNNSCNLCRTDTCGNCNGPILLVMLF